MSFTWTDEATKQLLFLWKGECQKGERSLNYRNIAILMRFTGYQLTSGDCQRKIASLKDFYREILENSCARVRDKDIERPYFKELQSILNPAKESISNSTQIDLERKEAAVSSEPIPLVEGTADDMKPIPLVEGTVDDMKRRLRPRRPLTNTFSEPHWICKDLENSKRYWTKEATMALLSVYEKACIRSMQIYGEKRIVYKKIAKSLKRIGHDATPSSCRNRISLLAHKLYVFNRGTGMKESDLEIIRKLESILNLSSTSVASLPAESSVSSSSDEEEMMLYRTSLTSKNRKTLHLFRWSNKAAKQLLFLWGQEYVKIHQQAPNNFVSLSRRKYQEICDSMQRMGYDVTSEQCFRKIYSLRHSYTKDYVTVGRMRHCPFYNEMNAILNGTLPFDSLDLDNNAKPHLRGLPASPERDEQEEEKEEEEEFLPTEQGINFKLTVESEEPSVNEDSVSTNERCDNLAGNILDAEEEIQEEDTGYISEIEMEKCTQEIRGDEKMDESQNAECFQSIERTSEEDVHYAQEEQEISTPIRKRTICEKQINVNNKVQGFHCKRQKLDMDMMGLIERLQEKSKHRAEIRQKRLLEHENRMEQRRQHWEESRRERDEELRKERELQFRYWEDRRRKGELEQQQKFFKLFLQGIDDLKRLQSPEKIAHVE